MSDEPEEIIVKPSTELIPDEYEHEDEKRILVHIFFEKREKVECFINMLISKNYNIPNENEHNLSSEDSFSDILDNIKKQSKEYKGLLILFSGHSTTDGEIMINNGPEKKSTSVQRICREFDSYNCPHLRNSPKIFIFEVEIKEKIQVDYLAVKSAFQTPYDTPAEADILIIYNKYDEDDSYLQQFTNNMQSYCEDEDVVTIATCVKSRDFRPLIISTLTRKFFFTCNNVSHRGKHYQVLKVSQRVKDYAEEVQRSTENKIKEIKAKKPRPSSSKDQVDRNSASSKFSNVKKNDPKPRWQ